MVEDTDPNIGLTWKDDEDKQIRIVRLMDEGGMGKVYEALRGGERVALKTLKPDAGGRSSSTDPKDIESKIEHRENRFVREIGTMMSFDHPNIMEVHGHGDHEQLGLYYTMEFIENSLSLEGMIDRKGFSGLSVNHAMPYFEQTLDVLRYFAELKNPIAHRDIKPGNIMIDYKGNIKISDFGLVRILDSGITNLTQSGTSMGTPAYISPEQAGGKDEITPKADVYSLGATFFHLLTGRMLYEPKDKRALVMLSLHMNPEEEPRKWPQDIKSDFPPRLEDLIMMMIAKPIEDRLTARQAIDWLHSEDPQGDIKGTMRNITNLEGPIYDFIKVDDFRIIQHYLDLDQPEELKKFIRKMGSDRVLELANLHKDAGFLTARSGIDRFYHFGLCKQYQKLFEVLEEESMVHKLAALEGRRTDRSSDTKYEWKLNLDKLLALSSETEPTRSKKPFFIGGAVLLASIFGYGVASMVSNSNISKLKDRLGSIQQLVDKKDFETARVKHQEVSEYMNNNFFFHDISGYQGKLNSFDTDINKHKDLIDVFNGRIEDLQSGYESLKKQMDDGTYEGGIKEFRDKLRSIRANIDANQRWIDEDENKQFSLNLDSIEERIIDFEVVASSQQEAISRFSELRQQSDSLSSDYDTLKNDENLYTKPSVGFERLKELRNKINSTKSDIQDIWVEKKWISIDDHSGLIEILSSIHNDSLSLEDTVTMYTDLDKQKNMIKTESDTWKNDIDNDKYHINFKERVELKNKIDILKQHIKIKEKEILPQLYLQFMEDLDVLDARFVDLEKNTRELATKDYTNAKQSLDKASKKLEDLRDPTRVGAVDSAQIVKQSLENAVSLFFRASETGMDIKELDNTAKTVQGTYEELYKEISWYQDHVNIVKKKGEGIEKAAYELGELHFQRYFDRKLESSELEKSLGFFTTAKDSGKTFTEVIEGIKALYDPQNQITYIIGEGNRKVHKLNVDALVIASKVYFERPADGNLTAAISSLRSISKDLGFDIRSLELFSRKYRYDQLDNDRMQERKRIIDNKLKVFVDQAQERFKNVSPQINPDRADKIILDMRYKLGYSDEKANTYRNLFYQ